MKSTLSLKKPLSFEQQAKIYQMMGVRVEFPKKKQQEASDHLATALKRRHPFIAIDWLVKTYPQCFDPKNPKPLKRGILQDILKQGLWTASKTSLRSTLTFYVSSPSYHRKLLQERIRYNLEGKEVEEITESEKEFSKQRLDLFKAKKLTAKTKKHLNKKRKG